MNDLTIEQVIAVLEELGLSAWQAEQGANDPALDWTMEKIDRCVVLVAESKADRPAAVLWSTLKRHRFPPAIKKPAPVEDDGPALCPWCKGPWSECDGFHGWAAKYRGMTADEIWQPDQEAA